MKGVTSMTIMIRKATIDDCPGLAKVHVDSWRTTYNQIVSGDYLDNLSYIKSEERWVERFKNAHENYIMYVALNEAGNIVGFANSGPTRSSDLDYDSELYAIYILKKYQRKRIGKQLMKSVVEHLSLHYNSMLVWVLAENESLHFYEALGGKLVRTSKITIGNKELDEIAYGWSNIKELYASLL